MGRGTMADQSGEKQATRGKSAKDELSFRKEIEDYYLPKQLVDAIFELGEIPEYSIITNIGIGFIDIAGYSYISRFLSPNENQSVLNGLYTALNWVINRHGGYLNKIEGDSLMFHFGGLTDPNIKGLSQQEQIDYIAREIFYTCVEMQRVVSLFNQANDKFIYENDEPATKEALRRAFEIIGTMRNSLELSAAFNALFQIRVRIGANIGEVTLGNFGPDGAKQWDVIGVPVIEAKRMESTAPIGGLRISQALYEILDKAGIVEAYHQRFQREAQAMFSSFRYITREELFRYSKVTLADKKNAQFDTYSVQVSPGLPEALASQVSLLVEKGEFGADRILEFLQYYRGNRFVTMAIQRVFDRKGIIIRREKILEVISPKKYQKYLKNHNGNKKAAAEEIASDFTLYDLFELLGKYQDHVNALDGHREFTPEFRDYDQYMDQQEKILKRMFALTRNSTEKRLFFHSVVYPLVFRNMRTSILEYQSLPKEEAELEQA
ncbi:MAG: adenylate/guanylate cyclase domain-containing protein [Spirochaetales bacterium]|nr:adenylate/guanylate cyclase domain-containing protein [Spirochaetales bacterium]